MKPVSVERDALERELLIAAVAARKLSNALEIASRELRIRRECGSVSPMRAHERGLTLLKDVLAEGPDPLGLRKGESS